MYGMFHVRVNVGNKEKELWASSKFKYIMREGRYKRGREKPVYIEHGNMPSWVEEPLNYWKACDEYERSNGRLYVEVMLTLHPDLSLDLQRVAIHHCMEKLMGSHKLPYSFAIHDEVVPSGKLNPHCHIMISERADDDVPRRADTWFRYANAKTDPGARKIPLLRTGKKIMNFKEGACAILNDELEKLGLGRQLTVKSLARQREELELQLKDLEEHNHLDEALEVKAEIFKLTRLPQTHEGRKPIKKAVNEEIKKMNSSLEPLRMDAFKNYEAYIAKRKSDIKQQVLDKELAEINQALKSREAAIAFLKKKAKEFGWNKGNATSEAEKLYPKVLALYRSKPEPVAAVAVAVEKIEQPMVKPELEQFIKPESIRPAPDEQVAPIGVELKKDSGMERVSPPPPKSGQQPELKQVQPPKPWDVTYYDEEGFSDYIYFDGKSFTLTGMFGGRNKTIYNRDEVIARLAENLSNLDLIPDPKLRIAVQGERERLQRIAEAEKAAEVALGSSEGVQEPSGGPEQAERQQTAEEFLFDCFNQTMYEWVAEDEEKYGRELTYEEIEELKDQAWKAVLRDFPEAADEMERERAEQDEEPEISL